MKLLVAAFLPVLASPQPKVVEFGATLFRTHCSVAYCHGVGGAAGAAPQLAGRKFTREGLVNVIREGIPKTAMPGFKDQMNDDWIGVIAVYVMSIADPSATEPAKPPSRPLSPEARAGRALFFDATRLGGCGACHAADGWGVAIGPGLVGRAPSSAAALRALQSTRVKLAEPSGEKPFPALPAGNRDGQAMAYDLSSPLPVLRSFAANEVRLTQNAPWSHGGAIRQFKDSELDSILAFLRQLP